MNRARHVCKDPYHALDQFNIHCAETAKADKNKRPAFVSGEVGQGVRRFLSDTAVEINKLFRIQAGAARNMRLFRPQEQVKIGEGRNSRSGKAGSPQSVRKVFNRL